MSETIEPQEAAYIGAKSGYELFGEPLKPFSPSRQVAAQTMGMMYPFIGEEGAAQAAATGMYPGVLRDIIICLWLCLIDDEQPPRVKGEPPEVVWTPARATGKPTEANAEALRWAGQMEITNMQGERFAEALGAFMSIVTAVEASKYRIHSEEGGAEDDGPKV